MLFSELYGSYYNTVAEILKYAVKGELTEQKLREAVSERGFGESALAIPAALKSGKWQLLCRDLSTPLKNEPMMPLTTLEKRWLKAISLDARVRLFGVNLDGLSDITPLFTPEMVCYYDRYSDGDDFEDEGYITRFRIILDAIKTGRALRLKLTDRRGSTFFANVKPMHLEYSEKDDKFRLITSGCKRVSVVNLSRITDCEYYYGEELKATAYDKRENASVTFELFDDRNALERAMLHFAHFEKAVEKTERRYYKVKVLYDPDDETELLIRILSFGPFIKVTEPESFVNIIKERLERQKRCGVL